MRTIEATLAECEAQIAEREVQKAYEALLELIQNGSEEELRRVRTSLEEVIQRFYKKRKRDLAKMLAERLDGPAPFVERTMPSPSGSIEFQRTALQRFEQSIADQLRTLSELYIFQWGTYYQSTIERIIRETLSIIQDTRGAVQPFKIIGDRFAEHSSEIFTKGYRHLQSLWSSDESSRAKALAGLRSFLLLPIEIYADQSALLSAPSDCRVLRRITSKVISGILIGFARSALGRLDPGRILADTVRSWAHALALCTVEDLSWIGETIDLTHRFPLLGDPLQTLAAAIDTASEQSGIDAVVIVSASLNLDEEVLDIALRAPNDSSDKKPLEVCVLSGPNLLAREQILRRRKRGFIACIGPYSHITWGVSEPDSKLLNEILIPMSEARDSTFLLKRLRLRFYESTVAPQVGVVLRTNIAERFPLENPAILAYFRVRRPSIRALDRIISTRTGVMLWCSVRRSGKSTGVTELSDSAERSSVVLQRCEFTSPDKTARVLFESIQRALEVGTSLPGDFLRKCVTEASPMRISDDRRSVLIIDEYDRLFGTLRAYGRRNEDLRNLVIQPLLDQFVEFATTNLVILLGQQPNAHYIFMDQNQLSAYVQQQAYPLFSHEAGAANGEFWDLLTKVFQKTLRFDTSFADALYLETGGHPFLTVNVLRDLVDWLIGKRVVSGEVHLTQGELTDFGKRRLIRKSISSCSHYEFFRAATSDAVSDEGRSQNPWLYYVYALLAFLVSEGGAAMSVHRTEVESWLEEILEGGELSMYSVDSFIASARDSNFIVVGSEYISPRIPILARVADATRRRSPRK